MQTTLAMLAYTFKRNLGGNLLFIALALLLCCWVARTNGGAFQPADLTSWWSAWLDPLIGMGTFCVAVFVWLGERRQDWEEQLPRRLTVRFVLLQDGKPPQLVMLCREADLTSAADIRQWGQQIGKQMNQNENLGLEIYFDLFAAKPQHAGHLWHKPYFLQLYLSELPLKKDATAQAHFSAGDFLVWEREKGSGHRQSWRKVKDGDLPPLERSAEFWVRE
jgi:hypothetical protein